jgi:molybdenum cofactor biosynthesis enzyme MoaA
MIIPELVDGCNLGCALCWNRNRKGSFRQMPLETVRKVLEVFGRKANYHWYNWGEPLLYNAFHEFVYITRNHRTAISTNLSLKLSDSKLGDLASVSQIIVSLSGLTKEVYNIYHQGGNFDLVMHNINQLTRVASKIRINWIKHPGNAHQEKEAKAWCEATGFTWGGFRGNCEVEELMEGFTHPFLKTPRHYSSKHLEFCKVQRWVPIDVDGNYLLCCTSHNIKTGYTIWDNITKEELRQIKMEMPFCKQCYAKGYWRMF